MATPDSLTALTRLTAPDSSDSPDSQGSRWRPARRQACGPPPAAADGGGEGNGVFDDGEFYSDE
eukprot:2571498-Prymnesium_polylepis.1